MSTDVTLPWLLGGDPAIRWQARRDLLDEPPASYEPERARVATEGWGARLLELQDPAGTWSNALYSPKWTSTTYTLLLLRDLGLLPEDAQARRGCELLEVGFLDRSSYWARGRPLAVVQKSLEHSLCFGVYAGAEQVGLARVVTDYATFAWVCDVFIAEAHRGHGLGKWLIACVVTHPDLRGLKQTLLATRDAHELYRRYGGFEGLPVPEKWMIRRNQQASQPRAPGGSDATG